MKTIFRTAVLLFLTSTTFLLEAEHPEVSPSLAAEQAPLLDDDALKAHLQKRIRGENDVMYAGWTPWDPAIWFRKETGNPSDERMHAALTAIYREAETREGKEAHDLMTRVVLWLGVCSDNATKAFLLEVAADEAKGGFLRTTAISSYLRVADAEETKKVLLRFLAEGDRMDSQSRSTIIWSTLMVYQDATAEKKRAIVESLCAALAGEDHKWLFRVYDDVLCQISPHYTHSLQRRDILARLIKAPALCKADDYAMPELEEKLREIEKANLHTTINTNLSALKERDFSQPLPEEERIALEVPPNAPDTTDAAQEKPSQTRREGLCPITAVVGLLAVIVLWFVLRGKRGSV